MKKLKDIFKDDKTAKQIHNAAKRVTKGSSNKRGAPDESSSTASPKRSKISKFELGTTATPFQIESSLALPDFTASEEELSNTVLLTNRAPLVLAFAASVTKYTMPEQPISSRLSMAQTVVSLNSRSKAVSLGLESGKSAEEMGWGQGQPAVKILGREIPVLKRWDYDPQEGQSSGDVDAEDPKKTVTTQSSEGVLPPLWGLDLESMRKNADDVHLSSRRPASNTSGLPIHTAESARSYLLKSFTLYKEQADESSPPKKQKKTDSASEKEKCLGLLLHALDIVLQSWAPSLSTDELDRRAWSWYLRVRPDVQTGVAGWGEKGRVKLADILALQR